MVEGKVTFKKDKYSITGYHIGYRSGSAPKIKKWSDGGTYIRSLTVGECQGAAGYTPFNSPVQAKL